MYFTSDTETLESALSTTPCWPVLDVTLELTAYSFLLTVTLHDDESPV